LQESETLSTKTFRTYIFKISASADIVGKR